MFLILVISLKKSQKLKALILKTLRNLFCRILGILKPDK